MGSLVVEDLQVELVIPDLWERIKLVKRPDSAYQTEFYILLG